MIDYEAWRRLFWFDVMDIDDLPPEPQTLLTNLDFTVEDLSSDNDYCQQQ